MSLPQKNLMMVRPHHGKVWDSQTEVVYELLDSRVSMINFPIAHMDSGGWEGALYVRAGNGWTLVGVPRFFVTDSEASDWLLKVFTLIELKVEEAAWELGG